MLKLITLFSMMSTGLVYAEDLIMGYPDSDKLPLIGGSSDNSGAYFDLYTKAAEKLGMTLKIVRMPKKRVHEGLKDGSIDFYPGASFSKERADYMMWIDNGFETKEVCLTPSSVGDITDISKAGALTILAEQGGSKTKINEKYSNVSVVSIDNASIEKLFELFKVGRGNLFIIDIEEVDYFKKKNGADVFSKNGVKVHYDCLEKFQPMYLGFSRKSAKYKEVSNTAFDSSKELGFVNLPTKVEENSLAGKLGKILHDLKQSGETKKIHEKYFK